MDLLTQPIALPITLVVFVVVISLLGLYISSRTVSLASFFQGASKTGHAPTILMLTLSQVTTWIFARSLMNAAILGYFYGFAGTLAYTCYYLSFLTGLYVVEQLRQRGACSVQDWLSTHFGRIGCGAYNFIIGLRLLSEVFANLLVVGLIFSHTFPQYSWIHSVSILVIALLALSYSMLGGLRASLRTDVIQMCIFLFVFVSAWLSMVISNQFSFTDIFVAQGMHQEASGPGWILVMVALLQVFSYPVHDPVMMDRGFIADRHTTRQSFIYAFVLSTLCIFGFGMFGIQAALLNQDYSNQLLATWQGMFGIHVYFLIVVALLISALSTIDSALASAARLLIDELKLAERTIVNGRVAMLAFMLVGCLLTLWGNRSLFDAVAVSGTASMFLTPVLVYAFIFKRIIPVWSFLAAFMIALLGAIAYLFHTASWVQWLFGTGHKYDQLLAICWSVLACGFSVGMLSLIFSNKTESNKNE